MVKINYKNKSMLFQDSTGKVVAVANGNGPRNVLVELPFLSIKVYEIFPRGNLNETLGY